MIASRGDTATRYAEKAGFSASTPVRLTMTGSRHHHHSTISIDTYLIPITRHSHSTSQHILNSSSTQLQSSPGMAVRSPSTPPPGYTNSYPHTHAHPGASAPIPISPGPNSALGRATSLSRPPRRASQSIASGTPGSSLARRPSRAIHTPVSPPKPLSHEEALEALRGFLKERSSYDVFPVSFRMIVLDTQLKVKKALDVMLLYGEFTQLIW